MQRVARITSHLTPAPVSASGASRRFEGQVCVVTGGARGIGFTCAERLAKEGAKCVFLFDIGDGAEAVAALKKINPAIHAESCKLDLTKQAEVDAAVKTVGDKAGRIDVLVQAAGVTGKTNIKTHEVDVNDFQFVFDVNVKAIFLCCRAVLPWMLKTGYGRIVNIASISGKEGNAGMLAYSSSKAAVIGLTKVIGKEYVNMGKDITVNCVAPAVVKTAMVAAMPQATVDYMTAKIPMARCGEADEVSATVAFAASTECSFTTGFCFDATGGRAVY